MKPAMTFHLMKSFLIRERAVLILFFSHLIFSWFIGRFFGLAPDEQGYLETYKGIYSISESQYPQSASGWIAAPDLFLQILYAPAKVVELCGIDNLLAIRILSNLLICISYKLISNSLEVKEENYS